VTRVTRPGRPAALQQIKTASPACDAERLRRAFRDRSSGRRTVFAVQAAGLINQPLKACHDP
jgi:hypothetical protein